MIKIEDFKNAPFGATATHPEGARAVKIDDGEQRWITPTGLHVSNEHVWGLAYTLDPPAPESAREALDLAWELAYEVKEGQHILEGTRYLELLNSVVKEYTAQNDVKINSGLVQFVRTLEPLPDPKPDWLDAPAVLARTDNDQFLRVWSAHKGDLWASTSHTYTRRWQNLRDVTPLYPKGQDKWPESSRTSHCFS